MDTIWSIVLSNALAAIVLALVAALAGRLCRRPALTHALWLLVLLKLITPPVFRIPVAWLEDRTREEPSLGAHWVADVVSVDKQNAERASNVELMPATHPTSDPESLNMFILEASSDLNPPLAESESGIRAPTFVSWQLALGLIWGVGSLGWWCVAGMRMLRFQRVLTFAEPAPSALHEDAAHLARALGLRRSPGIWFVVGPVSPMLWAPLGKPRLLLPIALWSRLSEEQRATLLAHELAHVRRRDHWVRLLELFVLGVYWWHPVAWWARRALREAEEQCCDAWVVWALPEAAPSYATALVETVAFLSQARAALPAVASGIGHVVHLQRRLTMIMNGSTPRTLSGAGLLIVLMVAVVLLSVEPTTAQSQRTQDTQSVDKVADPRVMSERGDFTSKPTKTVEVKSADPYPYTAVKEHQGVQAENASPPSVNPNVTAQIQAARDQMELLEAQLEVKRRQIEVFEKKIKSTQLKLSRMTELAKAGQIGTDILEQARTDYDALMGELTVKQAELLEPEVRYRQAKRRYDELQRMAGPTLNLPMRIPVYQQVVPPRVPGKTANKAALFEERSWDFGIVQQGLKLTHFFRVTNKTNATLQLREPRATAGSVKVTPFFQSLEPGESSGILVDLETKYFVGPKRVEVYVPFGGNLNQEYVLTLRADSRLEFGPVPPPATGSEALPQPPVSRTAREQRLKLLLEEVEALRRELGSMGNPYEENSWNSSKTKR